MKTTRKQRFAFAALAAATAACAALGQGSSTTSAEVAALQEAFDRIELQKKILDAQRAMLTSSIGQGVTLPGGKVERIADPILPSAIHLVSYDALRDLAPRICADVAASRPPKASAPYTVLATTGNLRDVREQRLAVHALLTNINDRVQAEIRSLTRKPPALAQGPVGLESLAGAPAALLALDAVGAVGKAIAGLAGFFKTDRQIGAKDGIINEDLVLAALRTCPGELTLVDPFAVEVGRQDVFDAASSKVGEALLLTQSAERLRELLDAATREAKDPKSKMEELKRPIAVLAVADAAVEKLYAIDDKTGMSPIIALARMSKVISLMNEHPDALVLSLKVLHSSGYSQISRAWWRNDHLDFAAGIAIAYTLRTPAGEVKRSNVFYAQTPWERLNEASGSFDGKARSWR